MKYCHKCGSQINNEAQFCTSCGEKLSQNNKTFEENTSSNITSLSHSKPFDYKKFLLKILFYIKKAPLIFNGALMFIFSCPMYMHFQNIRLAGVLYNWCDSYEKEVWNKAISARDTLNVFVWLSIILIISGIILIFIEKKGLFKKTDLISKCCLYAPLAITLFVIIYTYPKIINYANVFRNIIN